MSTEAPRLPLRPRIVQDRYACHRGVMAMRSAALKTLALIVFAVVPTAWGTPGVSDSLVPSPMAAHAAVIAGQQSPPDEPAIMSGNLETISSVDGFYEPDDLDRNGGMYDLTTNYYGHMSSPEMSVNPAHPWDLGINPYVPDLVENWWYGRTPDGTGGAWANDGNVWTYWSRTGDLVATFRSTYAGDPAIVKTATFNTSSTFTIDLGWIKYESDSGATTTIYLRPVE